MIFDKRRYRKPAGDKFTLMKTLSQHILELEELLLQRHARKDIKALERLLHDDFEELASSGEYCNKGDAIEWLIREDDSISWSLTDFRMRLLSGDVALASYCACKRDLDSNMTKFSMRTSIWQKVEDRWMLRYHQGTNCKPLENDSA